MEKSSKKKNKIIIGLVVVIASLIGIFVTIFFPLAFNPLQLTFSFLYVVGMLVLAIGLIENRSDKFYWFLFLSIGILILISLFTPVLYNLPGIGMNWPDPEDIETWYPNLRLVSWLWDYLFVYSVYYYNPYLALIFYVPIVFYMVLIIIVAIIMSIVSFKLRSQITNIIKYGGLLRTGSNFLIILPIGLFITSFLEAEPWIPYVTIGFAVIGPFFLGILTKLELRTFQKKLELTMDDYQRKRYKVGYATTILGGYVLIILSTLSLLIGGLYSMVLPSELAILLRDFFWIMYISIGSFAFFSIFCSLFSPRIGMITLLITGILILIFYIIFNPFYIVVLHPNFGFLGSLAILLHIVIFGFILIDVRKTRKILKLSKQK